MGRFEFPVFTIASRLRLRARSFGPFLRHGSSHTQDGGRETRAIPMVGLLAKRLSIAVILPSFGLGDHQIHVPKREATYFQLLTWYSHSDSVLRTDIACLTCGSRISDHKILWYGTARTRVLLGKNRYKKAFFSRRFMLSSIKFRAD